jgi:hypothetical protein
MSCSLPWIWLVVLAGCTDTPTTLSPPDGGAVDGFSPGGATSDLAAAPLDLAEGPPTPPDCSALSTTGVPSLQGRVIVGTAPAPTGGKIDDGRYLLTTYTLYAPASEPAAVMVYGLLEIHEDGRAALSWDPYSGVHGSLLTYQGTTLTFTESCPKSGTRQSDYSVSGGTLRLYQTISPGRVAESTFTPQ